MKGMSTVLASVLSIVLASLLSIVLSSLLSSLLSSVLFSVLLSVLSSVLAGVLSSVLTRLLFQHYFQKAGYYYLRTDKMIQWYEKSEFACLRRIKMNYFLFSCLVV